MGTLLKGIRRLERHVKKFESVPEIEAVMTQVLMDEKVKEAFDAAVENVIATAKENMSGKLTSKEKKLATDKATWQTIFKIEMYDAMRDFAVENYFHEFDSWNIKKLVVKVVESDVAPETVIEAIEKIEMETIADINDVLK